jgi:hypothetical protein
VVMPEYTLATLQDYPIAKTAIQPQIFIFPVTDLGVSDYPGKAADSLQTLLENRQAGQTLPYLPPNSDVQAIHAQMN